MRYGVLCVALLMTGALAGCTSTDGPADATSATGPPLSAFEGCRWTLDNETPDPCENPLEPVAVESRPPADWYCTYHSSGGIQDAYVELHRNEDLTVDEIGIRYHAGTPSDLPIGGLAMVRSGARNELDPDAPVHVVHWRTDSQNLTGFVRIPGAVARELVPSGSFHYIDVFVYRPTANATGALEGATFTERWVQRPQILYGQPWAVMVEAQKDDTTYFLNHEPSLGVQQGFSFTLTGQDFYLDHHILQATGAGFRDSTWTTEPSDDCAA